MGGIYIIENSINNKVYVGQSISVKTRLRKHKEELNRGDHANTYLQNAWNKYGAEAFKFAVIWDNLRNDCLDDAEIGLIECLGSMVEENGYNLSPGGSSNRLVSDATRAKQSASQKALHASGYVSPNKGKKLSKEAIEKRQKTRAENQAKPGYVNPKIGTKHSEEACMKLRGIKRSDELKQRLSDIHKQKYKDGYVSHNKGRVHTEESRKNFSEGQKRRFSGGGEN